MRYVTLGALPDLQFPNFESYRAEVGDFYEESEDTLPWMVNRRPSTQAQAIIQLLQGAWSEGLNPVDYDGARWTARLAAVNSRDATESELVRFDLAVTISTMRYVSDLHRGRVNPRSFHFDLDIANQTLNLSQFLREELVDAANVSEAMKTAEPPFPAYRRTIEALQAYTRIAGQDGGETLPSTAKPVKPGDSYTGVARLTRLLNLLGDLPQANVPEANSIYTDALASAVRHFQQRHGLDANGIIDAHTLRELNTPLSQRLLQLQLTAERWRWLPHEFASPPLVVNIPEFRLYVTAADYRPVFTMSVVVGRAYKHKTPVFATQINSVIFRPYWNVPLDIQRNELLPEIQKDPDYLSKHDYEVVDSSEQVVSAGAVSETMLPELRSGKLRIRQRPGSSNSLGLLKFDMPNSYDIYMHDTPATQLFSRSRRDFSHGCIRVEDPVRLAAWVLRDKPEWDAEHIVEAMNGEETFRVALTKPIPVLILYGTATVSESGEVHFFDDIYGYDAALARVLAKGYPYEGN